MKLEPDLIKEILIWCETNTPSENRSISLDNVVIPSYTKLQIAFHTKLLVENFYIGAIVTTAGSDFFDCIFKNLTLDGYELLNIMRNDTVGSKVKKTLNELGLKAFPILLSTAIQVIQNSIK